MNQRMQHLIKCQEKRERKGRYIDKGRGGRKIGYHHTPETKKKLVAANKPRLKDLHGSKFFEAWDRIHRLDAIDGSIPSETTNEAVSFANHPRFHFSSKNETQAGTSYPKLIPPLMIPACNNYENQGAEIDLSVVDGKHNRTGRRQARSLGNSRLIVGSNPTHPIPTDSDRSLLSDPGAGHFSKTTNPTPRLAPTIIMRGNNE